MNDLCSLAGADGAVQTAFERVAAPGYERRPDVSVAALTLQLPLEGKLLRGGVVGVIKTADDRWLKAQQHGAHADFFISTREVNTLFMVLRSAAAWHAARMHGCFNFRHGKPVL